MSGQAIVFMQSQAHAEQAMQVLNRKMMGSRYIEVFLHNVDEVSLAPNAPLPPFGDSPFGPLGGVPAASASALPQQVQRPAAPKLRPAGDTGGSGVQMPGTYQEARPTEPVGLIGPGGMKIQEGDPAWTQLWHYLSSDGADPSAFPPAMGAFNPMPRHPDEAFRVNSM